MTGVLAISQTGIAVMVAVVVAVLFLALLSVSLIRVRRGAVATAIGEGPAEGGPAAPAARPGTAVSRRDFFRRSLVTSLAIFGAQFGGASIAFLWPNLKGGFGSLINLGSISDIKQEIQSTNQPFYYGVGKLYVIPYTGSGKDSSTGVDYQTEGAFVPGLGLMALYQRCVHLGCRVPFCLQSQWFECPCHGSKYNKAGEYQLGPAPTGLQRFPISVSGNTLMVDTSTILPGPPRGTDTIHEPPQGPFCVGT
jgi:cytochrome b6-f complex iron-sulfur subunit